VVLGRKKRSSRIRNKWERIVVKRLIKKTIKNMPYLRHLFLERDQLRIERDQLKAEIGVLWMPPGHFLSPIPSIEEISLKESKIFNNIPREIPEINLNEDRQIDLLDEFKEYYRELPFDARKKDGLRYYFENPSFEYGDAIILYCMIRHVRPKRFIEVGSGYSSCVTLDTNELFFDNDITCSFVDPYPELLLSLITDSDKARCEITRKQLQDIDLDFFSELSSGDILFIDSTHVSKINSDVNYLFFEILPLLKSGVYVHFHDVFYPFEYPKDWVYEGRAWNEAYLLRAFLQYNSVFDIQFFNSFMHRFHRDKLSSALPLCMKNPGGSIWLKKI
jgi:hypothetical protein